MQPAFFDINTLLRVKELPLAIKTLAQGFLHGIHASQQRGVGIEFSQYRAYEPGDQLSKIDWQLFARSDKYFVREAERESDVSVWIVLDCSGSMLQQSQPKAVDNGEQQPLQGQWHKFDYARYLAATIAYIAQQQGDAVGLLTLSEQQQQCLPCLPGERHWQKLTLALTKLQAHGRCPDAKTIIGPLSKVAKNALIVIISDFHQAQNELENLTAKLSHGQRDVVAFHLDSSDEITFPYHGLIKFQDLETGAEIHVAGQQVRTDYLAKKKQTEQALKAQFAKQNCSYFSANIDQALDQSLVDFLSARAKRKGW
ncbi:Protein of unknown function DUF58 [Colwellia chukchiensis]|uniref:DUF58 domain-containing protein n=1 Tax=Colwellia chukchiensis TaxID=641665 RepID=A0A1H7NSG1_9GAMM|nr:DUF58 domain-containing protein [Colwellia chukchiensis]SEL26311.1 Protein of unknown function DUF58 [Colwellia chukchiensis]